MEKSELENRLLETAKLIPYYEYNHIEFVCANESSVTLRVNPTKEMLNPYQKLHGGLLYTLMDCTAGMTARIDMRRYVTQNANIHYLVPASCEPIVAVGNVVKRGVATCIIDVKVFSESKNHLLTSGTFTMFCIGKKSLS